MSELHKPRIAILASGGGTTAEAFIHATQDGRVDAEVGLVVHSREKAGVVERIQRLNSEYGLDMETNYISRKTHPDGDVGRGQTLSESEAICDKVTEGGYDHVALMGYMIIVKGDLMEEYGWRPHYNSIYQARMTNTHPGPLPETEDTWGIGPSEKVIELYKADKIRGSRHTFHVVAPGVDKGPIIAAHPVEILPSDTPQDLFDRVQIIEKAALPYALGRFLAQQEAFINGSA